MAGDLNRVMLIGRLVRDPELKYIQSGTAVASFSIANNRIYNAADGTRKEEVSYYDCSAWGKLGEVIVQYMHKGSKIAIEGRLRQNRWEDQDGNKRSKIEIVADNVQFLDSKASGESSSVNESHEAPISQPEPVVAGDNPFSDDDIPF